MIALTLKALRSATETAADLWRFTQELVQDMRQTRKELEDQYGPLGF
jgi:hypothetical protein